jgi:WD40 repeat protein
MGLSIVMLSYMVTLCAEVTSVEMNKAGSLLLSGSKDNSNRLWDVRLVSALLFTTAL